MFAERTIAKVTPDNVFVGITWWGKDATDVRPIISVSTGVKVVTHAIAA